MMVLKGRMHGAFQFAYGGPWNGEKFLVPADGTLIFKLNHWHGRYDRLGIWRDA